MKISSRFLVLFILSASSLKAYANETICTTVTNTGKFLEAMIKSQKTKIVLDFNYSDKAHDAIMEFPKNTSKKICMIGNLEENLNSSDVYEFNFNVSDIK